jgi:hypothetical protein
MKEGKEWLKNTYAQVVTALRVKTTVLITATNVLRISTLRGLKTTLKSITSKLTRRKPQKDGGHYLGVSVSWLNTYEQNRAILLDQYTKSLKYLNTRNGRSISTCPRCESETLIMFYDNKPRCFTCTAYF